MYSINPIPNNVMLISNLINHAETNFNAVNLVILLRISKKMLFGKKIAETPIVAAKQISINLIINSYLTNYALHRFEYAKTIRLNQYILLLLCYGKLSLV